MRMSWRCVIYTDRAALMKCRRQIQPGRREQARGNHGLLQCPWHNCICIWRAQCCAGNPGWFLSLTAVITVLLQSSSVAAITMYACIQQPQSLPWLFYLVSGHAPGVRIKEASKQPCVLHACSSAPCIAACACAHVSVLAHINVV